MFTRIVICRKDVEKDGNYQEIQKCFPLKSGNIQVQLKQVWNL